MQVGCKFGTHLKVMLPRKEKSISIDCYTTAATKRLPGQLAEESEGVSDEKNSVMERENT